MTIAPVLLVAMQNTSEQELTGIAGWAVSMMEALGGLGVALLIAIENLFPPIPSEIILPLAGFTASQGGSFTLVEAIVWASIGSVAGAIMLYGIARLFGRERTRAFLNWLPLTKESDVDKTEEFFEKYKRPTVFFGRMLPIFRSLISLPAGVVKMNFPLFIVLTTIGSAIWNTALVSAGFGLGSNWHLVESYVGVLSKLVLAVVLVGLIVWLVLRLRDRRRRS